MAKLISCLLFPAFLILSSCSKATVAKSPSSTGTKVVQQEEESKIAETIQRLVDRIVVMEATSEFIPAQPMASFSNTFVKVDDAGNIQCYIYLNDFNAMHVQRLEEMVSKIELTNQESKSVQAWVMYTEVEEVAGLDFVERITPPEYGTNF